MKTKTIRVGILGVGRGQAFAAGISNLVGMKLVALCDKWEDRLSDIGKHYGVTTYTDYDRFLEHDMDAVILANYFHEHAPFAIKALEAGYHVMSECACNSTLAEGVALCRAVERTGLTYMLAENYPYSASNMEMRRVYRTGEIGNVAYADGEYNHPMPLDDYLRISPGVNHWRNWLPSTYYCTHALAPLMYITDTMPVKVNALSIACSKTEEQTILRSDPGSVILCRMDNGAVFRLFGLFLPGHSNWYRIHGDHGAMEVTRGLGYSAPEQVHIWHEEWDMKPGGVRDRTYLPDWPEHAELARKAGHGGGDFWTNFEFANAITTGIPPFLNVYRGVTMSSVGILAWKSALDDGIPLAMPDFKNEADRKKYENDTCSPFPSHAKTESAILPPSILGAVKPSKNAMDYAKRIWKSIGYPGK